MELYQQGCLDLPEDVIKIWADNGFGKMVSRRQGNANPRVTALPPEESAHGYQISTIGGKKYYICWLTSSLTGLRLCSVFDYHEIYGQINTARNALIFGECAILLLFAWVLLHMACLPQTLPSNNKVHNCSMD